MLTLWWPISLHSHKPPGPHCFEPFTCNVYRSFQPHNMHMCKQFLGKVSRAKMFFENQTYLWFVWSFLQNEVELKIKEIFIPWKAKHTGKICSSTSAHTLKSCRSEPSLWDAHVLELPQRSTLSIHSGHVLWTHFAWRDFRSMISQKFSIQPTTVSYVIGKGTVYAFEWYHSQHERA